MQVMFWVWLGVIILTAIIEFATLDMTSIWFTVGAIIPLILSIVKVRWEIQVAVFVVLSLVLILSLRKITKNFLLRNAKDKTNLDSLVGQEFKLIDAIDDDKIGTIKVNGVIWNAIANEQIASGEKVKILKIQGNKFVVEKSGKPETENKEEK